MTQAPWFDHQADTRPMVTEMCALCTQDIQDPIHYRWPNGAVAHAGRC